LQNYKFAPTHRLLKADEFSSVFLFRKVRFGTYLKIYYKPSDKSNSRLGLIVSKKVHKRANKRNYMKRVLREFFRLNQAFWNNYDIVVRVHKCFGQTDFTLINSELAQLTKKFIKQSNAK
jgi:ribonuclease P protein component